MRPLALRRRNQQPVVWSTFKRFHRSLPQVVVLTSTCAGEGKRLRGVVTFREMQVAVKGAREVRKLFLLENFRAAQCEDDGLRQPLDHG